jgi:ACT domain-containing protein
MAATVGKNILEEFFDRKELAILKLFLYDEVDKFYLKEISKKSRVPIATTFRILQKFKKIGVIEETLIKKTKLYSLSQNKNTKILSELFEEKKTVLEEFIEAVSKLEGVLMIVAHGDDGKDKANILVIGNNIDVKIVKEKVGDIKEKYNFSIIELVLSPEQFNQMSMTGLIPEKKTILWEAPSESPKNS